MKKVVVIGGGTGVFTVLSGLREYPYDLSAIVSMADDGGSTGILREEFGMLPPGDIRRALVALSRSDNKLLSELFNYRFEEGSTLRGHSMGNLLLTALERITGSFQEAVKEAVKILNVKGQVIPVTLQQTRLVAELENGEIIRGETNIDIPKHDGSLRIRHLRLDPSVSANPESLEAIKTADVIIIGPGDVFTSLVPNLLVGGMAEAINNSSAKVIYILNIMTKFGETYGFTASDFVRTIEEYLGTNRINELLVNTEKPSENLLRKYKEEKDELVTFDKEKIPSYIHITEEKLLRRGKFLRHDSKLTAKALSALI